ncbi:heme ABC exporter ATP-binding protein CcmA [Aggregatilinea lenta]|uniref:heme ABC exporter ATP-binding protein CcmA n=1 Tax=Aggregatilinea lenta TaxID=913108 RepID=UPI000E5B2C78|nr:heme ABC exporter ATP-binding protein CcmA [Aggregatilinea lenta]
MPEYEAARPMIEAVGLTKIFGYNAVLRGLDLEVQRGEFLALFGPNGSGKSTFLRITSALARPTAGIVRVGGWDLPDEAGQVRAQLGVVSHLPLLYDTLTAEENLLFFARLYGIPPDEQRERIDALLRRVGLGRRARDVVHTFSRGMQQRLAIARAILHDPAVLLLDEPYTGLDQDAAALLDDLLREVAVTGRTVIMTTHDLWRGHALADRIAILSRGKIAFDAPCRTLHRDDLGDLYADVTGAVTAR